MCFLSSVPTTKPEFFPDLLTELRLYVVVFSYLESISRNRRIFLQLYEHLDNWDSFFFTNTRFIETFAQMVHYHLKLVYMSVAYILLIFLPFNRVKSTCDRLIDRTHIYRHFLKRNSLKAPNFQY